MTCVPPFRAVGMAGLLALVLTGPAAAATLRIGNGNEPSSLDPHKIAGDWEDRIVSEYLEGLVAESAAGQSIPGQAESWTISADGLVYTFLLRADAKWSDGVAVTAQHFVDAFQRLFDPTTAAEYAYLQFPIRNAAALSAGEITDFGALGVRAIDDRSLEITLENPTPYFIDAMAHFTALPIRKDLIERHGNHWTRPEHIVGNGPYTIVEWVPGAYLRGVKSQTYYDRDLLGIDEVVWTSTPDLEGALKAFRAGELDILTDFPADQMQFLQDNYPGQPRVTPFLGIFYYELNQAVPPLDDVDIRKALSLAVRREVIGPEVTGTGELPAYGWVPPGTGNYEGLAYLPEWSSWPYEQRVAEARRLLAEAGYGPDNPLVLQLRHFVDANQQRIAVAIAEMWKQVGVELELYDSEVNAHFGAMSAGDFQIGSSGWVLDYSDASNTLELLRGPLASADGTPYWGNNYGHYANGDFDDLLEQASAEPDLGARAALLHRAEIMAMDDFAAIPIYWYVSRNLVSNRIEGFVDNAEDIHRIRWLSTTD